jgi:hypothetical protein
MDEVLKESRIDPNKTMNFKPKKWIVDYLEEHGVFKKYKGSKTTNQGSYSQTYKLHIEETFDIFFDLESEDLKSDYIKNLIVFLKEDIALYLPFNEINRHKCYQEMLKRNLIQSKEIKEYASYFNADGTLSHYYEKYLGYIFPFEITSVPNENIKSDLKHIIDLDETHKKVLEILENKDFINYVNQVKRVNASKGICHNVTYRRMEKVMNGYIDNKGNEVEGLGENLTYLQTSFVRKSFDKDFQRKQLSKEIFNLIKIKENTISEVEKNDFKLFFNQEKIVGYYSDNLNYDILERLKEELLNSDKGIKILYTKFNPNLKDKLFIEMRKLGIELKQIPESLLYL